MSALRRLIPLADRVLVKRIAPVAQTAGGVYLPESKVGRSNEGEVVAVGPGSRNRNGEVIPVPVSVGDRVLLPEYGGQAVKIDEDEVFLFRGEDILAKFEK